MPTTMRGRNKENSVTLPHPWRKTTQTLMPSRRQPLSEVRYDIYPSLSLGPHRIFGGFDALAQQLAGARQVVVDGFPGVIWPHFRQRLAHSLHRLGVRVHWVDVGAAFLPPEQIDAQLAPYLGGDDPIFGFRYDGDLRAFFAPSALSALAPDPAADLNILSG